MTAWRLLSLLLQYPDTELLSARDELAAAAARLQTGVQRDAVAGFLARWQAADPMALQQEYVEAFDFNRRATLDLSFLTHGDRRQRGLAMLALKRRYREAGFELRDGALPDHVPVLLELAALAPPLGEAALQEFRPALEVVRTALHEARSPYAPLLDAVCAGLPPISDDERARARELAAAGPPSEQVGLEPFAPPEVMPEAARAVSLCAGGDAVPVVEVAR